MGSNSERGNLSRVQEWTADPCETEETVEDEEEGSASKLFGTTTCGQEGTRVRNEMKDIYEMIIKDIDIPAAVIIKIFRRPTRSMKRRERHEQIAYSVPTQAASK
jgi:hypothetical protein